MQGTGPPSSDDHTFDLRSGGGPNGAVNGFAEQRTQDFCYNCRTMAKIVPRGSPLSSSAPGTEGCHTAGCPGFASSPLPVVTRLQQPGNGAVGSHSHTADPAEDSSSDESPLLFAVNPSARDKEFSPSINSRSSQHLIHGQSRVKFISLFFVRCVHSIVGRLCKREKYFPC